MDEHTAPAAPTPPASANAANLPQPGSPASLARKRFGNFACAHFCYAIVCFFLGQFLMMPLFLSPLPSLPDQLLEVLFGGLLPLVLMGGYLLLGYCFGGKDVWPLPLRGGDFARSVLAEAAVAWCWAALVIWAFAAESDLVFILFCYSVFLAAPSSLFVWMGLAVTGFAGMGDLVCAGFLAGLLPPLLFNLGSYWKTRRSIG